jgi:hypothetical protein
MIDPTQKIDQAAFSASARAYDRDAIARRDLQVDVSQGYDCAVVIETADAIERDLRPGLRGPIGTRALVNRLNHTDPTPLVVSAHHEAVG